MIRGRQWLGVVTLMVLAQGVLLHLMGQPWIAASGIVKLWQGITQSPDNSQHIADWYTLSHVVHGFLFYGLLRLILPLRIGFAPRLALAAAIEIGWELLENTDFIIDRYRAATISLNYHGDSVINSVFDTAWMMLGFSLAAWLPWQATLALAVALELLAGFVIHDNLILNILMLVHPSDAVRTWQAGT